MYEPVPPQIAAEVGLQQDEMGWPEMVPKYANWRDADGKEWWTEHKNLSVSICEQIVEWRTRLARRAIREYKKSPDAKWRHRAGRNILYARLYRCQYLSLIGKSDSTEADMPFPCGEKPIEEGTGSE